MKQDKPILLGKTFYVILLFSMLGLMGQVVMSFTVGGNIQSIKQAGGEKNEVFDAD